MPAPLLLAQLARHGLRGLPAPPSPGRGAALGAGALAGAGLLLVLTLFAAGTGNAACPDSASLSGPAALSEHASKAIPQKFVAIYTDAAQRHRLGPDGWAYLASVHSIESTFADSGGSADSTAGAQGPMQFMPDTWRAYAQDGNGDGTRDVQNVYDAIFGAANYLRASGAPRSWDDALFAYNHADWYVDQVTATALDYLGKGAPTTYASTPGSCRCPGAPGQPGDTTPAVDGAPAGPLPDDAPQISWPTPVKTISSPFGMRWGRLHAGVDVPLPEGTPLTAAAAGNVVTAAATGGYGNYTCIQHARAFSTCYGHQSKLGVRVGQQVAAGQRIGLSGNTGNSTGPHLHFETRLGQGLAGAPVDPAPYLAQSAPPAGGQVPGTAPAGDGGGCSDTQLAGRLIEGGELLWPLAGVRGQVGQGPRVGTHRLGNWQSDNAVDILAPAATKVVAVADATVCAGCGFGGSAGSGAGRMDGMRLTLDLAGANQAFYTHLQSLSPGLGPGDRVRRGQVIGRSGTANNVPHLHFATRLGDPLRLLGIQTAEPARAA